MQLPEIEQIFPDLFRAAIPLPDNPLKATNSYFVKGKERNLVIDTGMNREECLDAFNLVVKELNFDLGRADFFITHMHADHVGLAGRLPAPGANVYFNAPDAQILNYKDLWQVVLKLANRHGFPAELVAEAVKMHPGQRYSPGIEVEFKMVEDKDVITCGRYSFSCIRTPGHSPGHTCLYEPVLKLLFSGDHILGDITPNISTWLEKTNPLGLYFESLEKTASMAVDLVLPGHRSLVRDCRARVEELKKHHAERLSEVLAILGELGEGNAYRVATRMTWDLVAEGWDDFPLMQKWFASGEALAHIRYLEESGKVKRLMKEGNAYFRVA